MARTADSETDYARFYDLERYLFEDVSQRYNREKTISTFDFFCIVIWKANRAKSKVAKRLLAHGKDNRPYTDLNAAVKDLVDAISKAPDAKARLKVLIEAWGFRLPMASAILTVLYPDDFTVYDFRVCEILGKFEKSQDKKFEDLWGDYSQYIEGVKAEVPSKQILREKDRFLWGQSFKLGLEKDIHNAFVRVADDSELE